MKLTKILLSTSLVLPLATLPILVSCSEKGEITTDSQRKYGVSNTEPIVSIPFRWTGDKTITINATIVEKGSYDIEIVGSIKIQDDGDFNLDVMFKDDFTSQTSEKFDVTFTYLLNDKEASQTFTDFELVYRYEPIITDDQPKDFIYNRSFSLMGYGASAVSPGYAELCWGTAWILSDATKNTYDDYQYYVATNWHVKCGIDKISSSVIPGTFRVCYGHSKRPLDPSNDYNVLTEYIPEDESKFTYSGSNNEAIDFYIAKINFGSRPADSIKPYLNYLNELQKEKGYITKTAQTNSTNKYNNLTTYMGGYPVRDEYYATWGFQTITANYMEYIDDQQEFCHFVDDDETIKDVSPLYTFKDEYYVFTDWMPGGASGSMLIANIEDEWQVIGIYWGGYNVGDYWFWPAFSIFNSNYKDFSLGY